MIIGTKTELLSVLRKYNPWWMKVPIVGLPSWRRTVFSKVLAWVKNPPGHRALLLSGARQIGKTTLLLQTIEALLESGVSPSKILYVTFDHPLLKFHGVEKVIDLWQELEPEKEGIEYLFLDEIQYVPGWQTWLKHQVDFCKNRHIAVTGSATPLVTEGQESGVGRWHTLSLATLSFFEYLQIKQVKVEIIPKISSFSELFNWKERDFYEVAGDARFLVAHFQEYLLRGGFPQSIQIESITQAQQLLREDILDKVLKRDMTALFGVRRVQELEQTFLYLCLHDGALLNIADLCKNLEVKKATANNFISLLEAAHLIYRLSPFGYGKEILRARYKIYLADPAIAPSVMLKGKSLLEDPKALGIAVETVFFKHAILAYRDKSSGFSYWRGTKDHEVDLVATVAGELIPFEVKYRDQATGAGELKGLKEFCAQKKVSRGYVITKESADFSLMSLSQDVNIAKIPAALACYWLGAL